MYLMKKAPFCIDWLPTKPVLIGFPRFFFLSCFSFAKANRKKNIYIFTYMQLYIYIYISDWIYKKIPPNAGTIIIT